MADDANEQAARFVEKHSPPVVDAWQKWNEAFALAKKTNRRVWVRISQRYCGPCFQLNNGLDDHRTMLEKEFVLLKIDDVRDKNGVEVAKEITGAVVLKIKSQRSILPRIPLAGAVRNAGGVACNSLGYQRLSPLAIPFRPSRAQNRQSQTFEIQRHLSAESTLHSCKKKCVSLRAKTQC
jgi:hypothetical protein